MERGELHINIDYDKRGATVYGPYIVNATRDLKNIRSLEVTPKIRKINKIALSNSPAGKEFFNEVKITDNTQIGLGCRLRTYYLYIDNGCGKAMPLIRHFAKFKCLKIIFVSGKMLASKEEQMIIGKFGIELIYTNLNDERLSDNSFNIDSEEFLIENGVLREYRGNDKNVVIPHGTVRIASGVFTDKKIESIEIPDTVVAIEPWVFANNNLRTIKIPSSVKYIDITALDGNPLDEVYISTNTTVLNGRISDPEFKNKKRVRFYITNQGGNFINFLKTLFNNLVNINFGDITILGNNLSILEKAQIKRLLDKYNHDNNYNEPITICYSINDSSNQIESKKDNIIINIEDEEIQTLLDEIYSLISLMSDSDKKVINDKLEALINKYKENILKFDPDTNPDLDMELFITTPDNLRSRLLKDLNKIKSALYKQENIQKMLQELATYKSILNGDNIQLPSTLDTILDKIKVIVIIARASNNEEITTILVNVLEEANNKLSSLLSKKITEDIELSLTSDEINIKKELEEQITELLSKCASYSLINSVLDGLDNSAISYYINVITKLISALDGENKDIFSNKLTSLKSKYGFGTTLQKDTLKEIYEELLVLIADLRKIVTNSSYFNKLLDDLNMAIKITNNESVKMDNNSLILSLLSNILTLLDDSVIAASKKEMYFKTIIELFISWKDRLLNEDIKSLMQSIYDNNKEPIFNEKGEIVSWNNINYSNLADSIVVELAIAHDLNRLISDIIIYKNRKNNFLELKRKFNLT